MYSSEDIVKTGISARQNEREYMSRRIIEFSERAQDEFRVILADEKLTVSTRRLLAASIIDEMGRFVRQIGVLSISTTVDGKNGYRSCSDLSEFFSIALYDLLELPK